MTIIPQIHYIHNNQTRQYAYHIEGTFPDNPPPTYASRKDENVYLFLEVQLIWELNFLMLIYHCACFPFFVPISMIILLQNLYFI
jgi:hypothetical protein